MECLGYGQSGGFWGLWSTTENEQYSDHVKLPGIGATMGNLLVPCPTAPITYSSASPVAGCSAPSLQPPLPSSLDPRAPRWASRPIQGPEVTGPHQDAKSKRGSVT